MKKSLIMALALTLGAGQLTAYAEQPAQYLPEKGDISLGFDIVPLVRTLGNAWNVDDEESRIGATPFDFDGMMTRPNVSVMGKYMVTDKWGIKLNLGVAVNDFNERSYVQDDLAVFLDPMSNEQVVDGVRTTKSGVTMKLGGEYRVGEHRVQGVFGMGLLFGFSTYDVKYTYGNKLTGLNPSPTTNIEVDDVPAYVPSGYRIIEARTPGGNFAVGAYATAGIEWFVAPKISLGAEVNLALYGMLGSKGVVKSEGFNSAYNDVETFTQYATPGNRGLSLSTDNIGGALSVNFYF